MPNYVRWKGTGAVYFFTVVTYGRRPWFADADHRRYLGHAFRETRRRMAFHVDPVVMLPDHLHVVMRPADGVDYSAVWRSIKASFTRRVVARLGENDPALRGCRPGGTIRVATPVLRARKQRRHHDSLSISRRLAVRVQGS